MALAEFSSENFRPASKGKRGCLKEKFLERLPDTQSGVRVSEKSAQNHATKLPENKIVTGRRKKRTLRPPNTK